MLTVYWIIYSIKGTQLDVYLKEWDTYLVKEIEKYFPLVETWDRWHQTSSESASYYIFQKRYMMILKYWKIYLLPGQECCRNDFHWAEGLSVLILLADGSSFVNTSKHWQCTSNWKLIQQTSVNVSCTGLDRCWIIKYSGLPDSAYTDLSSCR